MLAFRANPIKVGQALGRLLNNVKHLLTKRLGEFFDSRANAFDHPRAEVFFNPLQRAGRYDMEGVCLELQAMGPVRDPPAVPFNVLARVIVARCRRR